MADNITLPARGTGTTDPDVATEDISGVDYQRVKLIDGTVGSTTPITAISGKMRVSSVPYTFDIAEGNVPAHYVLRKFGHNSAVGSSEEAVWDGSAVYPWPTAAEQLQVVSGDVDDQGSVLSSGTATGGSTTTLIDTGATFSTDTVAAGDLVIDDTNKEHAVVKTVDSETQLTFELAKGTAFESTDAYRVVNANDTGAAVVEVKGLDASYAEITEYVVLNGQTDVTMSASFLRVFRVIVRLAGSSGANEGAISVEDNASSVLLAQITAGENQTLMAIWTVPAGFTAYMTRFYSSTSSTKATEVRLRIRQLGEVFAVKKVATIFEGYSDFQYDFPLAIPQKSDIQVTSSVALGAGEVSAGFDLWYE